MTVSWKFSSQFPRRVNVTRHIVRVCGAAGATSTRRRVMSYDEDDVTPTTLSELRLDDRSVQRRRRQPASATHTTTTTHSETTVASPLAQTTTGTSTRPRPAFGMWTRVGRSTY